MPRVLVVDDDPDLVEAARLFLESKGYEVASAGSRSEAMSALAASVPDLLILDVMMDQPDDGIAMAQELRAGGFTKPILMLTSVSRVTGMSFAADDEMVPVDAFLEKPVRPETLLAKVAELLAAAPR